MSDASLYRILRCPRTGASLRPATSAECDRARGLTADPVSWEAGLIAEAGFVFYPIENGIPMVVRERAIVLEEEGKEPR